MKLDSLIFEKFGKGDFEFYFQLVSDENVMKMITGKPLSRAEATIKFEHILGVNEEKSQFGYYTVRTKTDEYFIGLAKLVLTQEDEAEAGYMLLPAYWGKGYGMLISQGLIKYSEGIKSLKKLIAIIDPENKASKRILEKCGFKLDEVCEMDGLPAEIYRLPLRLFIQITTF